MTVTAVSVVLLNIMLCLSEPAVPYLSACTDFMFSHLEQIHPATPYLHISSMQYSLGKA